eukprot:TRINITY_DN6722_c0_g1_i1.p1 TRINITY_DN6722_c0_g1~~TRINITY_DN6722_c0_g1_i1.p1  ORF type:complete len:435 (-),score=84.60 TRINITY_DN6722_c0_g1_i1:200-1504(-)
MSSSQTRNNNNDGTPPASPNLSSSNGDDGGQVASSEADVLDDEPKNLILNIISQLRIGMDLSRITLPTFILEPRSMLEKLTDFMAHEELLAAVPKVQDPLERAIAVLKWYMSGFYIKPQGVKKPYNPILGETFRSHWRHEAGKPSDCGNGDSITHYVAEQVSHHPPISALYVSNRKEGFIINGSIHPRSRFLGTSAASILEGEAVLTLLPFDNEQYIITFPSAYARGILFGTLLMEMCGVVTITCPKTGIKSEVDFKAKPFWGGEYNAIVGKIKNSRGDTLYNISGLWDEQITITNTKTKQSTVLWDPRGAQRLPRYVRSIEEQDEFESQRLWSNVTEAIRKKDQRLATDEKTKLEDAQRQAVKERKDAGMAWNPRLFTTEDEGRTWTYKYINLSPYDPSEGVEEEKDGIIYPTGKGLQHVVDSVGKRTEDPVS